MMTSPRVGMETTKIYYRMNDDSHREGVETTWIYYRMTDDFAQRRNGDYMYLL